MLGLGSIWERLRQSMSGETEHYTPTPISSPSREKLHSSLSQLLPYLAWLEDERLFVLEGNEHHKVEGLGFCLEMWPQTGASEEMGNLLTTIFSKLPTGASVQWMLLGSPQIDSFLDSYIGLRPNPEEAIDQEDYDRLTLYKSLAQRQAEHFHYGSLNPIIAHQPYLLRNFRLVMSVVFPAKSFEDTSLIRNIISTREMIITTLKTYYQFHSEWDAEMLVNWCALLLNIQGTFAKREIPHINYDENRPIKLQMVHPNTIIRAHEDGLFFGLPQQDNEMVARCMTIRSYPKVFVLQNMGNLIGDYLQPTIAYDCPFLFMCGIVIPDFQREKEFSKVKSARATLTASSPMARFLPDLAAREQDWKIVQDSFDKGQGIVKMYHQLVLFNRPSAIGKSAQGAQAVFRKAGFELVDDTYMQIQAFLAALPMTLTTSMIRDITLAQRMVTKTVINAVNLAPLISEWSGVGSSVVPLAGRRGQVMNIDLFSNTTGNYNGVICGKSGSGKSVWLNLLTLSYLSVGARIWIIDIGHSFKKLCDQVGGQYIEISRNTDLHLPPFSMVENFDDDIEMLTALFAHMCSPSKPLDDYLKATLKMHIMSVWLDKGKGATVDDLQTSLINNCEMGGPNPQQHDLEWIEKVRKMPYEQRKEYCDPRVRDLGTALFPFTTDGNFGRYFHGEANINFDNNLIVLELEELAQIPDLRTTMMFLIMYKITQSMYLMPRNQCKICIIDEAWQLLDGGSSGDFIAAGYRRARKYLGSFLTATQSMLDYDISPASKAAMTNADFLFLLSQKPESISALIEGKKLMVDDYMSKLLRSVHTQQGQFAEVFIKAGDMGQGIGRILLDPYSLLMASSMPADYTAVKAYRDAGYSLPNALDAVLADRGTPGFIHPLKERLLA